METTAANLLPAIAPLLGERAILLSEAHAKSLMVRIAQAANVTVSSDKPAEKQSTAPGMIVVIPINGVLTKQPTWGDDYFGLCPAYSVMEQLTCALADTNVESIVLDIDSPGGFVNGSVELADAVAAAAQVKPVTAIIRGYCCSGAYWIASQCTKIIARPESEVGNIGVYSVLCDVSKFYSDVGIDFTLVASGQFKGLGADGKVSEDYISDTRRIINGIYQQFCAAVSKGRGLSQEDTTAVADGKAYLGPQALKLGLIDEVASSFDAAIQSVATAATASAARSSTMNVKKPAAGEPPAAPAATATVAKKGDDGSDSLKSEMDSTITSANKHRDQSRKMLDAYSAKTEDLDDDGKAKARQTIAALESASEEAGRCAKALKADAADGDDDDDDQPGEDGGDEESRKNAAAKGVFGKPQSFQSSDYIAAFGDTGARWFCESKPFAACAAEFITQLKAAHKTEIDAITKDRDSFKQKLESMDRGNDPASFSVAAGAQAGPKNDEKLNGQTPGIAAYANSIKLPTAPAVTTK